MIVDLGILFGMEPICRTSTQMPFKWACPLKPIELVGVAVLPRSACVEHESKIGELNALGLERESVELERERPECVIDEI